jgi:polar amino acid transport system permease protein
VLYAAVFSPSLLAFGDKGFGDELAWGALRSIQMAVLSYLLGWSLGLLGATGKISGPNWLRGILDGYTTIVRSVPELVLILLLFYAGTDGLNKLVQSLGFGGLEVNGMVAAVCVLGFVYGAYLTEILRAAIQAVPVGQTEAAKAYGMSSWLLFRRVTLPAMLPNAIPGMANVWLESIKGSSLIAVVGYTELSLATRQAAGVSKQYLMFFLVTAFIYLALTLITSKLFDWLETRTRRGQPRLA